jgi:predicted amidophosphoribosyltransferase
VAIRPQSASPGPPPPTVERVLLDLLLPQRCVVCGSPGAQLCAECLGAFPRLGPTRCERCGAPTAWTVRRCVECSGRRLAFVGARAAVVYDDAVRAFVLAWKERGLRKLAATAASVIAEAVERPAVPLTFVGSEPSRARARGHHPAEALARELGQRWELPVLALVTRASGVRQRALTLVERRANVRGAFSARPAPGRIVLVDDVYTSGATAHAAASALRRAGARHVEVITLARAVRGYTVRSQ